MPNQAPWSDEESEAVWTAFERRFGVEVTALQLRGDRFVVCLGPPNLVYCDDMHYADTGEPLRQWETHPDPDQPLCCATDGLLCAIGEDLDWEPLPEVPNDPDGLA